MANASLHAWATFAGADDNAMVDGDFVVFESELQPVLKSLRKSGINIVAIHHHMTGEQPRSIFLHYLGPWTRRRAGWRSQTRARHPETMKRAFPRKATNANQRDLDTIKSSVLKIRVLHHLSGASTTEAELLLRLSQYGRPVSRSTLTRVLASMVRGRWLKTKPAARRNGRKYFLASEGRQMFSLARRLVNNFAASSLRQRNTKQER
jgi:hypothetical protein